MRHFRFQIVLRVVLIAATTVIVVLLLQTGTSYMAAGLLSITLAVQLSSLIRLVDRTNRDVARFLRSVRYSDFSQSFSANGWGESFADLNRALMDMMDDFRSARSETEEHYRFLQTVMQHIGVGLISFQRDGSVGLINNAAKRLVRVQHLKNIGGLREFSPPLVQTLSTIRSGEKKIVKVVDGDELLELVIYGTEFKMHGTPYTLVSIQDIQMELEEKEIEAWQKLTRVLTHEIMNSITPISSLATTVHELLDEDGADHRRDVREAVQTIERRSQSLLRFVQAYRSLTRIPRPDLTIFPISDLFSSIEQLFRNELEKNEIVLHMTVDPSQLDLTADATLIEQILINVVKNSVQALSGTKGGRIELRAWLGERGRPVVQVTDNGPGIEPEAVDKVFIPFFTTKKDGSGIGMSLSRQIMRQHGGSMSVKSHPGEETIVSLRF